MNQQIKKAILKRITVTSLVTFAIICTVFLTVVHELIAEQKRVKSPSPTVLAEQQTTSTAGIALLTVIPSATPVPTITPTIVLQPTNTPKPTSTTVPTMAKPSPTVMPSPTLTSKPTPGGCTPVTFTIIDSDFTKTVKIEGAWWLNVRPNPRHVSVEFDEPNKIIYLHFTVEHATINIYKEAYNTALLCQSYSF